MQRLGGLGVGGQRTAPAEVDGEVAGSEQAYEVREVLVGATVVEERRQRLGWTDGGVRREHGRFARGPADALQSTAGSEQLPGGDELRSADVVEDDVHR